MPQAQLIGFVEKLIFDESDALLSASRICYEIQIYISLIEQFNFLMLMCTLFNVSNKFLYT